MIDTENHYVAYVFLGVLINQGYILQNPDLKHLKWLELVVKNA